VRRRKRRALRPWSRRRNAPRNVLMLTIDSLRADMPWTGYPRAIAPNLTKLAEESVVYTNEYALSSYTAKSVAGFLTSRYPSTLYRSGYFFASYPKADCFLAEVLHDHGIRDHLVARPHVLQQRGPRARLRLVAHGAGIPLRPRDRHLDHQAKT